MEFFFQRLKSEAYFYLIKIKNIFSFDLNEVFFRVPYVNDRIIYSISCFKDCLLVNSAGKNVINNCMTSWSESLCVKLRRSFIASREQTRLT